jgi:hypothetical protein
MQVTAIARPFWCDATVTLETFTSTPAVRFIAAIATLARRATADGDTYGVVSTMRCAS